MGSIAMGLNPLSVYEGENAVTPREREMCYDEKTGDIYTWHFVDNRWTKHSRTAEIQKFLDEMKASGVFTSAAAFVANRKIYRFYYDEDNGVVRIDPDLTFKSLYRYYAIRSIQPNEDGSYNYITGVTGKEVNGGDVTSALVNMDLVDTEVSDGTKVSVPQVGGLIGEVNNGNSYIVEFYDEDRNLVNIQAYQAIKVRTASDDLCPDTAVTDMYVVSNQQNSDGSIYLYQGQDVDELELQTTLKYADGRRRDVSNEEVNGGRLIISGLDEIDTSKITGTTDKPQTIEVTYQMIRGNTSFSSNSSYNTANGAVITPAAYTISKTVEVKIVQDTHNNLEMLIPVGYIEWDRSLATPQYRVKIKFFGHYSNGMVSDITNITTCDYSDNSWGTTQTVTAQVPYGNANQYKNFTFSITTPSNPAGATSYSLCVRTYGEQSRFITYDTTQNAGGQYSGKFTGFAVASDSGETLVVSASELLSLNKAVYNDVVPTHIRIRDVKDPTFLFTDIVEPSSNGIYFNEDDEHVIEQDRPLIIEFIHVTLDTDGNAISTFVTGAIGHYAAPASS